jgi:4a-hydroxytetrahydrobiopterin dehydratase
MNLQENIRKVLMETVIDSKGWGDSNQKLERTFKFKDFNGSIDFVNKVAKIAETQNHHPDIEIKYNKVKISITDHEKGGVSEKCHRLVKSIDKLKEPHKEEQNESEITEKCWKGYTQKGMKTMFGKRYPNCVKKTK